MPITRVSSRAIMPRSSTDSDSGKCSIDDSGSGVRANVRMERGKRVVKVAQENIRGGAPVKKLSGLPNIEDFKYVKPGASRTSMHEKRSTDVSEPDIRANVKTKRVKRVLDITGENLKGEAPIKSELSSLPDMEDFTYDKAYDKDGVSSTLRMIEHTSTLPADKKKNKGILITTKVEPPANWEKVLDGIKKMRLSEDAPVDTMGAIRLEIFYHPRKGDLQF